MASVSASQTSILIMLFKLCQSNAGVGHQVPLKCVGYDAGWRECPDFVDTSHWHFYTDRCCSGQPGLIFHCQEKYINNELHVITACLSPITCVAGKYAYLNQERSSISGFPVVSLECLSCANDSYNPVSRQSFTYRYPYCSERRQICSREYGKTEVTQGDTAHDTRCRCLLEDGWVSDPASEACSRPEGFVSNNGCFCIKDERVNRGKDIFLAD